MFRSTFLFTFGLAGAVLLAQVPAFHAQYVQRIGGAQTEAQRQVAQIDALAAAENITRDALIEELVWGEGRAAAIGRQYRETVDRWRWLSDAYDGLREAPAWARVWSLARWHDPALWQGATVDFEPAVPVGTSGLLHALVGFWLGGMLFEVLAWILGLPMRRREG